jgi:hypothetical protein
MTGSKRFYWVKLQVATAMYRAKEEELEDVEEVCRQPIDDSRCPKLVRIEAYFRPNPPQYHPLSYLKVLPTSTAEASFPLLPLGLHYWSAKNQLDRALEVAAACEKDVDANKPADKHALITLVEAKQGAQELLDDGTAAYEKEWRAKGRDPAPDKDEWREMEKVEIRGRPHLRNGLWMHETWGRAVPYCPRRQDGEVCYIDLVE